MAVVAAATVVVEAVATAVAVEVVAGVAAAVAAVTAVEVAAVAAVVAETATKPYSSIRTTLKPPRPAGAFISTLHKNPTGMLTFSEHVCPPQG